MRFRSRAWKRMMERDSEKGKDRRARPELKLKPECTKSLKGCEEGEKGEEG